MKQIIVISFFLMLSLGMPVKGIAQDPITIIIKEGITKVIKAVDLQIQRLQNETIWLQNAQKAMENSMSELRLNEIKDWMQQQKDLYKNYFEELWKVKTALSYYHRIKEITNKQIQLVQEYKSAFALFKKDKHFTTDEIAYMGIVYTGMLEESLLSLDGLSLVIHSFATQMSDAKRLALINQTGDEIDQLYNNVRTFNKEAVQLSLQRAKDASAIATVKSLYGLK